MPKTNQQSIERPTSVHGTSRWARAPQALSANPFPLRAYLERFGAIRGTKDSFAFLNEIAAPRCYVSGIHLIKAFRVYSIVLMIDSEDLSLTLSWCSLEFSYCPPIQCIAVPPLGTSELQFCFRQPDGKGGLMSGPL